MTRGREAAAALPAALAALGEAGVLFVLIEGAALQEGRVSAGPLASYPQFAALFVAGVALATMFRRSVLAKAAIPVVAVALGVSQWAAGGRGGTSALAIVLILVLAVALRVATLAVRDWREPIGPSFGAWAAVLLGELMLVGSSDPSWRLLPTITILFFAGSLGSRAATVWLVTRAERPPAGASMARPYRSAAAALAVMGLALTLTFAVGIRGGPIQVSGAFAYRLVAEVLAFAAGLIAAVLFPVLSWLFGLINLSFNSQPAREAIQRIRPPSGSGTGGGVAERVIGFVLFMGVFLLLVSMIWRRWKLLMPEEERTGDPEPEPPTTYVPRRLRKHRGPRLRRELPADTVRRWYAEALLALERLGLPKAPSRTPGEYLPVVNGAFPESARGFTALTRAYEQVRYGSISLEQDAVWRLEIERDAAMEALGRARRIDDPDQA